MGAPIPTTLEIGVPALEVGITCRISELVVKGSTKSCLIQTKDGTHWDVRVYKGEGYTPEMLRSGFRDVSEAIRVAEQFIELYNRAAKTREEAHRLEERANGLSDPGGQ